MRFRAVWYTSVALKKTAAHYRLVKWRIKAAMVLTSWKEIARYLNCGIRTAQGWGRDLQLTGRRVNPPSKRSAGVAFSEDVDEWLRQRKLKRVEVIDDAIRRHMQLVAALEDSIREQQEIIYMLRAERRDTSP